MELKGKVKLLKTETSFPSKKTDGPAWEKIAVDVYQFNSAGQKTEFNGLKADGSQVSKTTYTYNRKEKKAEVLNFDKEMKPTTKTIFILNDKGWKIEELSYTSKGELDSRRIYEYDEKGNNTKKATYYADGRLNHTYSLTYDAKGNLTESKFEVPGSPSTITVVRKFIYDDKGNMKEEIEYDDKGATDFRYERTYDDNGNKTGEITYKRSDRLRSSSWKYEYDKTGNWIKRTHITEGKEKRLEERTIVYY
jgi:hypothetical protein